MSSLLFLGCGTSYGVPIIGCDCPVCASDSPYNKRLRPSALICEGDKQVIIDTTPEFRLQALKFNVRRIDAVLITHCHADHIFGFDDLRIFNHLQQRPIECYLNETAMIEMRRHFAYIFDTVAPMGIIPQINFHVVTGPFQAGGLDFIPVEIIHGKLPTLGYKLGNSAYITDASQIPESSMGHLYKLKTLVINALRFRPHNTHFSLSETLALIAELKPERAYLTHLTHDLDYTRINQELPPGIELAFDGLQVEF